MFQHLFVVIVQVYVQDMMQANGKLLYETVCKNEGHFYVCGDVSMAADVGSRLEHILAQQGNMSLDEAHDFVAKMKVGIIVFSQERKGFQLCLISYLIQVCCSYLVRPYMLLMQEISQAYRQGM